jgi:hypothetical protein
VFYQPDAVNPAGYALPFHLDTHATNAQKTPRRPTPARRSPVPVRAGRGFHRLRRLPLLGARSHLAEPGSAGRCTSRTTPTAATCSSSSRVSVTRRRIRRW